MKPYIKLMRIDHWVKNLFMLPGVAFSFTFIEGGSLLADSKNFVNISIALLSLCFASSANYTINEWLDRDLDKIHPFKNHRIANHFDFQRKNVLIQYSILVFASIIISLYVNVFVSFWIILLLVFGILYNVKPFRTKDRYYLDVLSESINNPIRLTIGWYCIQTDQIVPTSAFISFWGAGIFLMSLKRYAEMMIIDDKNLLASYRRSFRHWTPARLIGMSFFGGLISMAFVGILLTRYRMEYIFQIPLLIALHIEYLRITLKLDQASFAPEMLMKKKGLQLLVIILSITFITLTFVDMPWIYNFIGPLHG